MNAQEEQYLTTLNQERNQNQELSPAEKESESEEKAEDGEEKKEGMSEVAFTLLLLLALINDLGDYMIVGSIPILGDLVDVASGFVLSFWAWSKGVKKDVLVIIIIATLIELIPFGDIIPTWTLTVIAVYLKENVLTKSQIISLATHLKKRQHPISLSASQKKES